MTWKYLEFEGQIPSRKFLLEHDGQVVPIAVFLEKETKELKFFTKDKLEEIGSEGILKILNSPTPASSQSGE